MTNTPNPTSRDGDNLKRKVRDIDFRVRRLEASSVPLEALNIAFNEVFRELDKLQDTSNLPFSGIARLENKIDEGITRLEGKIDTILQHLTGYQ